MKPKFKWIYYHETCNQCLECVATCKALSFTNLKRIHRDESKCTRCETCSTICNCISTEFQY